MKSREDKPYLLEALQHAAAALPEPAMLRPDLGTLRGQELLDAVDKLEAEGVLVADGGALVHRVCKTEVGRVFYDAGVVADEDGSPLIAAGIPMRREGSLCE